MAFDEKKLRAAAAAILSPRPDFKAMRGNADTLAEFVAEMTDETKADEAFFRAAGFETEDNHSSPEWKYVVAMSTDIGLRLVVTCFRDSFVVLETERCSRLTIHNPTKGQVVSLLFALSKGTHDNPRRREGSGCGGGDGDGPQCVRPAA